MRAAENNCCGTEFFRWVTVRCLCDSISRQIGGKRIEADRASSLYLAGGELGKSWVERRFIGHTYFKMASNPANDATVSETSE